MINKKRKVLGDAPKRENTKNVKKFKGNCYNCKKARHLSSERRKFKKNTQVNVSEGDTLSEKIQDMNLSAVFPTCKNVKNPREWWLVLPDICTNKTIFPNYKELIGKQLFMGNSASFKVEGQWKLH